MSVVHAHPEGVETWKQKLARRFKEEPLVPIGTALTCFALIMASRKVGKKGESQSLNRWFRARIIFQGATIAAIVVGSYAVKKNHDGAPQESPSAEELKLRERLEFEARLRKAEETHEFEQALRGGKPKEKEKSIFAKLGLGRGPAGSASLNETSTPSATANTTPPPPPVNLEHLATVPVVEATQPRKSWWTWGGKGSS
ncbi:hypoxia induced protein conserved region-domain-containing protein [Cytidiella melzeri]|nr:hypoxia induced protein conserved region-domain-containing protein [Cytidiella melzeri]